LAFAPLAGSALCDWAAMGGAAAMKAASKTAVLRLNDILGDRKSESTMRRTELKDAKGAKKESVSRSPIKT